MKWLSAIMNQSDSFLYIIDLQNEQNDLSDIYNVFPI